MVIICQKSFNKQLGMCNGNHETFIFLLFIKKDECLKNADRHDESNIQDTKYVQLLYKQILFLMKKLQNKHFHY